MAVPVLDAIVGTHAQQIVQLAFAEPQGKGNAKQVLPVGGLIFIRKPVLDLLDDGLGVCLRHGGNKKIHQTHLQVFAWIHLPEYTAEGTDGEPVFQQVGNRHFGRHLPIQDTIIFSGRGDRELFEHSRPSLSITYNYTIPCALKNVNQPLFLLKAKESCRRLGDFRPLFFSLCPGVWRRGCRLLPYNMPGDCSLGSRHTDYLQRRGAAITRFPPCRGARMSSPGLLSGGHHVDGMAKGRLHRLGDPFHKGGMGPQAGQQLFRRQAVHHPAGEFPDHIRGPWAHELGA